MPLVSVIMPCYNAMPFLVPAVESVLSQTFTDLELLIIDDGSTDDSSAVIDAFAARDSRVIRIALPGRSGPARARNAGIARSGGRYVAFLDSDDLWLPEKLSVQLDAMRTAGAALSFTAYRKMTEDGVIGQEVISVPQHVSYSELLGSNCIGCLTVVLDTEILGRIQFPDIPLRQDHALWLSFVRQLGHEDLGLWLRISKLLNSTKSDPESRLLGINKPLAIYRLRRGSVSRNKLRAAVYQWRLYRDVEHLGRLTSLRYFVEYAWRGALKAAKF